MPLCQEGLAQTKFSLLPDEKIIIEGRFTYYYKFIFLIKGGNTYLTQYRLVFCNNHSILFPVLLASVGGFLTTILGYKSELWFLLFYIVAYAIFIARKATKITFQIPISQIKSINRKKYGFGSKYTILTDAGGQYVIQFTQENKWKIALRSLGINPDPAAGPAPNEDQAAGLAEQAMARGSDWKPLAVLVVVLLVVVGFVLWRHLPSGKSGKETAATPTVKTPAATATVPKTSVPKASTSAPDQPKTPAPAQPPPIVKSPSTAAEYLQLGMNEKDPQKKIALYNKAIELDPKQAMAFNNRGFAYYTKKDYDQALKDYDQAIALKPDFALAYNNRGDAYYQRKEYDRAQADYGKAIGLKPDYDLAYYNRGLTYHEQKNYDQAINDFNKAISLKANFAAAYNSRGNAFFRKREFDLAINDYTKAVEVSPNWALAYSNRGNAWFEKKEFDQALKDYDQAIAKYPNYAWAYYRRAIIYNQRGDGEQARQNYAKAKALNPNLPELAIQERLR